jgi:hypothetical protein
MRRSCAASPLSAPGRAALPRRAAGLHRIRRAFMRRSTRASTQRNRPATGIISERWRAPHGPPQPHRRTARQQSRPAAARKTLKPNWHATHTRACVRPVPAPQIHLPWEKASFMKNSNKSRSSALVLTLKAKTVRMSRSRSSSSRCRSSASRFSARLRTLRTDAAQSRRRRACTACLHSCRPACSPPG